MADSQQFKPATVYDAISILPGGMNSGESPLLIEKTQAAFLSNVTTRDGFAQCRPAYTKNLTIVYPNAEVKNAVETGLFQGAMMEAYRPDSGDPSQIAQIGGRLFQFQIAGDQIVVTEITIPGDPNLATTQQVWIWQAENFVIVQDGLALPIFWDGTTSRRSYGESVVIGTQDAVSVPKPTEIGAQVTLNLTAPYPGPYNVPVLIDGEFYMPIANASGYLVNAKNLTDIPGTPLPIGSQLVIRGDIYGVLGASIDYTAFGGLDYNTGGFQTTLTMTAPYVGPFIDIMLMGIKFTQYAQSGVQSSFYNGQNFHMSPNVILPAGLIVFKRTPQPNVVVGNTTVAAVVPAVGAEVQLILDASFTGAVNQQVFINGKQYTLTPAPPPPGGSTVTFINLTNTTAGNLVSEPIMSVPELPAGRMGAYGHSQNWVSLVDGVSFIPSDISGGASGTPAYNYRDAVLKTTAVTFRSGAFRIPSAGDKINSITFGSNLDVSMGQGALMIGTERYIFSCLAPIDPSNIDDIILKGSPILTYALVGRGPLGQNNTLPVNSDIQFRSTAGLGSLVIARQQFTQSISGNTPISEEMVRVLTQDDPTLLSVGSAIVFDNRVLNTASPGQLFQSVIHKSLVAMNLDGLSRLRTQEQASYDGQWTGLNVLQLTRGLFAGVVRAFAFTLNQTTGRIEIYELLPSVTDIHFDNEYIPTTWIVETASLFNNDVKPIDIPVQLTGGEFAVDNVVGEVRIQVFYKPDQYGAYGDTSCWVPWHDFTICAKPGSKPLYFPRLGLPEPESVGCNGQLDVPLRVGYTFQARFVITGSCRLLRAKFSAVTVPVPKFMPPICNIQAP